MKGTILECSSAGDKRFSALYARVSVNGKEDTIENHYQNAKIFKENGVLVQSKGNNKGKKAEGFLINDMKLPIQCGLLFYNLMWYKYLSNNPNLVEVLAQYDDYKDKFKGNSFVCQADAIRLYMNDATGNKLAANNRGVRLLKIAKPLLDILRKNTNILYLGGDIFEGSGEIIGHQVNCQSVMNGGIAKTVRYKYPTVYKAYLEHCSINTLGNCQIVYEKSQYIANLYGQLDYGYNPNIVYTNYSELRKALKTLKEYAKERNLSVSLPFNIGCDKAKGDWNIVSKIIEEEFSDYYVLIYKYTP